MEKRLTAFACLVLAFGLTAFVAFSSQAIASIPGNNIMANADYTNTLPKGGDPYASMSDDGNTVAFDSTSNQNMASGVDNNGSVQDIIVRNLQTQTNALATTSASGVQADGNSEMVTVSRTGRYVLFMSYASNLIDGQTIPSSPRHIYLKDMVTGGIALVDQSSSGALSNQDVWPQGVSEDGRFALFYTTASNLLSSGNPPTNNAAIYIYLKDMLTGNIQMISKTLSGGNASSGGFASMSCDGAFIVFSTGDADMPGYTGHGSTYLADLRNGFNMTNVASMGSGGGTISCNGRYIVFKSNVTGITSDVVNGVDNHIFRYDRLSGQYQLIDKSTAGVLPNAQDSSAEFFGNHSVSDTGLVVFHSYAKNLIAPDAAHRHNTYLRNPEAGTTDLLNVNNIGQESNTGTPTLPQTGGISSDGKRAFFKDSGTNMVPGVTATGRKLIVSQL
jgi:hypothetical protein